MKGSQGEFRDLSLTAQNPDCIHSQGGKAYFLSAA